MSEVLQRYRAALEEADDLVDALALVQQAFPSSTNEDRKQLALRIRAELILAVQDREREEGGR